MHCISGSQENSQGSNQPSAGSEDALDLFTSSLPQSRPVMMTPKPAVGPGRILAGWEHDLGFPFQLNQASSFPASCRRKVSIFIRNSLSPLWRAGKAQANNRGFREEIPAAALRDAPGDSRWSCATASGTGTAPAARRDCGVWAQLGSFCSVRPFKGIKERKGNVCF